MVSANRDNPRTSRSTADAGARIDAIIERAADVEPHTMLAVSMAAITDADPSVRVEAVSALGERDDTVSRQTLMQALADVDPEVRLAAIEALARLGGNESVQALETALNDGSADLRAEAVDALGDIGGEAAMRLLRRVAELDPELAVREAAQDYLGELRGAQ